jgi:hypothetical protein
VGSESAPTIFFIFPENIGKSSLFTDFLSCFFRKIFIPLQPVPQKIRNTPCFFISGDIFFGFSAKWFPASAVINFSEAAGGRNFVRTKPQKPNVMKTIAKTLVAISILMISLQVVAGTNPIAIGQVHYKVQIHLQKDVPFRTNNIYVVILDNKDKLIAPPQLLIYGKSSYDFTEPESVIGTRKALVVFNDGTTARVFNCTPDVQTGKFLLGHTYDFNVFIRFQKPTVGEE